MQYTQLQTLTNYSFLKSASHPQELVEEAKILGYHALAITDECSLAGIVKAHVAAKELNLKLLVGSYFELTNGFKIIAIAPNRQAYAELSGFISLARRRASKGEYEAHLSDLRFRLQQCLIIWLPYFNNHISDVDVTTLATAFKQRLWIGVSHTLIAAEQRLFSHLNKLANALHVPLVASGLACMHNKSCKPLLDVLTAIRENTPIQQLGTRLHSNAEVNLKPLHELNQLYPEALIQQTQVITQLCNFSLDELRYQYPKELVPGNTTPIAHLRKLVKEGEAKRWPQGTPEHAQKIIAMELGLIEEMQYEYYFLTVHDIVHFARSKNILCQGRGSAANSVVCYCLFITEIAPGQINVLFERFISKERNEPPDIDVDFEHQRREEVIQYIYQKYGRERAALAATVITYRSRSAIRDVGKAMGLEAGLVGQLAKSLAWWDRTGDLIKRMESFGLNPETQKTMQHFFALVQQILGFPRHLSQHVGGFIITQDKVSDLVPLENASMPDRTIIQWDKYDIEAMGLLKVDVLALGMLTALRKSLETVSQYDAAVYSLATIPREDPATYAMLSKGDSIGVFQVESRAQMSMLPRLRPKCFYDLVIEIAIVRPGPIQGDMVHPYLRRRDGIEEVHYQNDKIKSVLEPTLGIPIFQEQAIRLAMVAADFSGGEADQLRRAMASWGKNGSLLKFEDKFIQGMLNNGYPLDFAHRLFEQIKGFGGYGFPESHSASFALLCYASSWLKCHHPAAFYCALLNSQPMGFYSASQLIQDARRHKVVVLPVEINASGYESHVVLTHHKTSAPPNIIQLGLHMIKGLSVLTAERIVLAKGDKPFTTLKELSLRAQLSSADLQLLASADALHKLTGNRHNSRWQAAALMPHSPLLDGAELDEDVLNTPAPSIEKNIQTDFNSTGLSLRVHPMALLRAQQPFNRCKKQSELASIHNGGFAQVAGLVTGRQRPGTAKGTLFLTLEDETGNINIVVWTSTQERCRQALLTAKLLLVKGRLETKDNVTHIIAGQMFDYSHMLSEFDIKSRDFH
ncbi:error-prone DNA polymerase [Saccharophagus degradans]|uniref:error-prone DNA polymerase n=1 Tax=Saccharophagus degradans TaxID=86304 RepID=UPI002477F0D6|nr:error-prone DNA polymerase [Saccharophagus degradans]WGO97531.1 error-prone DNA polymerase [Saccharophagus degradans]